MSTPRHVRRHRTITLVTRVKPGRSIVNRLFFAIAVLFPSTVRIAELGTVHTTRWSLLTRVPYNGPPQVRGRLHRTLLLWESDYTGPAQPYIAAFVRLLSREIDRTWRTSEGFPGVQRVGPVVDYINDVTQEPTYCYAAFPQETERTVNAALRVAREHRWLCDAAREGSPAGFRAVHDGFLRRRQGDL